MTRNRRRILFILFFSSGFCGLLYEMIWIRLAFAAFGIITPVLSVVISVFMLGLALGSWGGGKIIQGLTRKTNSSALIFYGMSELGIGLGAFLVPVLFSTGARFLLDAGQTDSPSYLLLSAGFITFSLFPWSVLMGTTFPFMMAFVRENDSKDSASFSFLYLANSLGAMVGTLLATFTLVELLGFRRTLWIGGGMNFLIASVAVVLGVVTATWSDDTKKPARDADLSLHAATDQPVICFILFVGGLVSLALEVVWMRAFTPIIGTQVYAYSLLLFVYLLATCMGSHFYRVMKTNKRHIGSIPEMTGILSIAAFVPVVINDPRIHPTISSFIGERSIGDRVLPFLLSIFPFCFVMGYLTPSLVDLSGAGNPRVAGRAYAFNIAGCVVGPLVASYILLPWLGAKLSMVFLALPFMVLFLLKLHPLRLEWRIAGTIGSLCLLTISVFVSHSYEEPFSLTGRYSVRRDHTATVISSGDGLQKGLLVNGVGITALTPITKFMAHLPMAYHKDLPKSALAICFGMGTTYRSLLSWNIPTTAVELLPAVRDSFGYFFDDAQACLRNPLGSVVIDDGRRFLCRVENQFDVITVDPPPPAEAAGSSLLYSEEFYAMVKRRLAKNGILQQWFAWGEESILQAVAQSLATSFPHVKVYRSVTGGGYHFLASLSPLEAPSADDLIRRLPDAAKSDLLEWSQSKDLKYDFVKVISNEVPIQRLLPTDPQIRITDDRPYNEYFVLRRLLKHS